MYKILMIEDDTNIVGQVNEYLTGKYEMHFALNLEQGRKMLLELNPDLILLDLILPDGNGFSILKNEAVTAPVIILTTMDIEEYHIEGLGLGAADYLVKPISLPILAKHIEIRLKPIDGRYLTSGKLIIDTAKRIVTYDDKPIVLTATEFDILVYLFKHSDSYHTAQEIYEAVYSNIFLQSTTMKMHLSHLRNKLQNAAPEETFISTMYGKGYRFLKV